LHVGLLAAVHGGLVPPIRELVIVRLPPVSWTPPPPRPELASWLFEILTPLSVRELLSSPPMIPPPPMVPPSRPPVIVSPEKLYWRPTRKVAFRHMTRSPGAVAEPVPVWRMIVWSEPAPVIVVL
jgi:hypothetical protein